MKNDLNFPCCPKCGCPARNVVLINARVRCRINNDGSVGEVLSASRTTGGEVLYECGGAPLCPPYPK